MKTTYILVAHRSGARLFAHRAKEDRLDLLEARSFPKGRLKAGDINSDRPGYSFSRMGWARSALEKEHGPVDQEETRTAEQVAELLVDKTRGTPGGEASFIVAAGPQLLGKIRLHLEKTKALPPIFYLAKDLANVPNDQILEHFRSETRFTPPPGAQATSR